MKWLVRMVNWFLRETWWRRYHKRITLDGKTPLWGDRCLVCDAGTPGNKSIRCDMLHDRECPCKYNQCLKYKSTNSQITIGTKIRLKTNPKVILSIISTDCHEDKFECSNGSVLSLKQIEKYYDVVM